MLFIGPLEIVLLVVLLTFIPVVIGFYVYKLGKKAGYKEKVEAMTINDEKL